jgi:hypothetical protein
MKRTLINGTYSLIREKLLGSAAPHLTIPACLEDGLFVIYQSHRTDPETTWLLRPATELTAGETRLLTTLRDACVSVGLLSIKQVIIGKRIVPIYDASDALKAAVVCGFQVPEMHEGDGAEFEELVSLVTKRTAEVGGFKTTTRRLKLPFPPQNSKLGVQIENMTDFEAIATDLELQPRSPTPPQLRTLARRWLRSTARTRSPRISLKFVELPPGAARRPP